MAKKKQKPQAGDRHLKRTYSMRLDEGLMDQVKALAERTRRTVTMEVTIAIEKHLREAGLLSEGEPTTPTN